MSVPAASPGLHLPSLAAGLAIMLAGTADPRLLAAPPGRVDHMLAALLFWAMSAGFVRGVGFVPGHPAARRLLSGTVCAAALLLALLRVLFRS